jgi:TetR/AcrR family transcriptional regulator, transcriptional repressor for nem operon
VGRPRSFDIDEVVEIAKRVFWDKGYRGTAIEDLEQSTKLSRSSLYWAFDTKKALFHKALSAYLEDFISPRLAPMEKADANVEDIELFFDGLAKLFQDDPVTARRGCLMVNSIVEFEGREGGLDGRAGEFRDRLATAFANALSNSASPKRVDQRAHLLTSATLGVWLAARIAPIDAAHMCDAWVTQVRNWRAEVL